MQKERFSKSPEAIPLRLASLKSASIAELKQQWQVHYGFAVADPSIAAIARRASW